MAYQANGTDVGTVAAGADLRTSQFLAVKLDNTGKAVLAGIGEAVFGILQNTPNTGEACTIRVAGQSKAKAGGTVAAGATVASGASGVIVAASGARVKTDDAGAASDPVIGPNVIGIAMAGAVVGDIFTIDVSPRGAVPATVAA
jgi:hypothetical protein